MAQVFPRWTNHIPIVVAAGLPLIGVVAILAISYWWSPLYTDVGYRPAQPVEFSHQLHAGDMALDCRYCHDTVERAAHAAVPPTATCMNCHGVVLPESPLLEPVRASQRDGLPIEWVRVHMLPDYAYFDHSVHIAATVGCRTCHGRVDRMPVVTQDQPLSMAWCLSCHRDPAPSLRPREELVNMEWDTATASYDPHADPTRTRELDPPLSCGGCHR